MSLRRLKLLVYEVVTPRKEEGKKGNQRNHKIDGNVNGIRATKVSVATV
jgi:hypothetical protein